MHGSRVLSGVRQPHPVRFGRLPVARRPVLRRAVSGDDAQAPGAFGCEDAAVGQELEAPGVDEAFRDGFDFYTRHFGRGGGAGLFGAGGGQAEAGCDGQGSRTEYDFVVQAHGELQLQ